MDIFKGKIELKCIETTTATIDSGEITNLGVTFLGVTGDAVFNQTTFNDTSVFNSLSLHYAPVEFYDEVTFFDSVTVDNISITTAIAETLNAINLSSQNANINILGVTCVNAEKINVNQLAVTGTLDFYGPVTFHSDVYGITTGASTSTNGLIGTPTDDQTPRPIDISTTGFTNDIGLNLTPTMLISDGFQIIDHYFKTYFLTPPPGVTLVNCIATAENITIEWQNFPKIEYAPLNIYLPHVEEMRIDYVQSSLGWDIQVKLQFKQHQEIQTK